MAAERGPVEAAVEEIARRCETLAGEQAQLVEPLRTYELTQAQDKGELINKLNLYAQKQSEDTAELKGRVTHLYGVADAIKVLEDRVKALEQTGPQGHAPQRTLLDPKNMTPKELTKEDDWRRWRSDVEDYVEEVHPGMRDVLERVRGEDQPVDGQWFAAKNLDAN